MEEYTLNKVFDKKFIDIKGPLVYRIYDTIEYKSYIGSTYISLKNRFRLHRNCVRLWKVSNKLYDSINRYGEDKFMVQILGIYPAVSKSELVNIEYNYIIEFNSIELGYNSNYPKSSNKPADKESTDPILKLTPSEYKLFKVRCKLIREYVCWLTMNNFEITKSNWYGNLKKSPIPRYSRLILPNYEKAVSWYPGEVSNGLKLAESKLNDQN